jgi:Ca2+-transporting ATPase
MSSKLWYTLSPQAVAKEFDTSLDHGLSSQVVKQRLEEFGHNELQEQPRPGFWTMLLDQFNNFVVLILIVASVISLALGDYLEAGAILTIVILNAILGVVQESKAEQALAALQKMTAPEADVIRDGSRLTIPSDEVVPGDVVILETGNYVPADMRLVESFNLRIEEASLTGESVPVGKKAEVTLEDEVPIGDRHNSAFMSTMVTYGRGNGVVTETGMQTEIGKIAELLQSYEAEPTPLQVKLDKLGRTLGIAALSVCGLVFVIGVIRNPAGTPISETLLSMFIVAVSLAIAAVPEGLPAVVTIVLALGMQRMIKRHALLRKLPAVETLGSATTICSDKTGTLTQNEMTAVRMWADGQLVNISGEGYRPHGEFSINGQSIDLTQNRAATLTLQASTMCNDALLEQRPGDSGIEWRMVGDPTEGALVVAAAKAGLWQNELTKTLPRVAEVPFEGDRKRMTTIHQVSNPTRMLMPTNGESYAPYVAFVKGAPEILLEHCTHIFGKGKVRPLGAEDRQQILDVNASLASDALRVLAAAYRPVDEAPSEPKAEEMERDLVFLGMIGMIDPARPEVKRAIVEARVAGIKTVMVTGDYPDTAIAIAKELDLLESENRAFTGAQLNELNDEQFNPVVESVDVYARVSPQHKVRIVEALQSRGHIVAMTGDGVNDAPALKRANIGVAMGITGTDVSKEASDMVLTDDNYASIVSAVEEGRIIYANIRKFVFYLLSCNVAEILIIFLAILAALPLPLTAIQLLVLNLITDGAPALALGMEKGDPDTMDVPPRPVSEPVINREMQVGILVQSIIITAAVLAAFVVGLKWFGDTGQGLLIAQTMAFGTLSISELIRAYTSRSERYSLLQIGIFSNKWMQYAALSSLIILLAIIYVPFLQPIFNTAALGWREWRLMLPLLFAPAIAAEITKLFLRMPRFQSWLHPTTAPAMLEYATRGEEAKVAVE